MERTSMGMSLEDLRSQFVDIDFPEYQREPNVWSREQKQRLVDSILRQFDISSIYFYLRDDENWECIDGRQRLNAIMSFFGENTLDDQDNGFPLVIENEISSGLDTAFDSLSGQTCAEITAAASDPQHVDHDTAKKAIEEFNAYELTIILLRGAAEADEFNLQFLRLNLGTLINAGEKLHAMVGSMQALTFERVGRHTFFDSVEIPTRRYTKEVTAAQVLLQTFSYEDNEKFARARHVDLQRFFKQHDAIDHDSPRVNSVLQTLDALGSGGGAAPGLLRNRAVTVSAILQAWLQDVGNGGLSAPEYWSFFGVFIARLRWQVDQMKKFTPDPEFPYLVEFQRHLTQASVERPAVTRRNEILHEQLSIWLETGRLGGDATFETRTGESPP